MCDATHRIAPSVAAWLLIPFLILGVGACEEDDPEVDTTISGDGTLDSPYIIESGRSYNGIHIEKGRTLFFIALEVPSGWQDLTTSSTVDIDLPVSGFKGFGGGDFLGSFKPNSGKESFPLLGDDKSNLYFKIDGSHVLSADATFDVSVTESDDESSPSIQFNGLPSCSLSNDPICLTEGFQFPLPFTVAPSAQLSVTIDQLQYSEHLVLATSECFGCPPGNFIPFPTNDNFGPWFMEGVCHAYSTYYGGAIGEPATCTINPVPGFGPPASVFVGEDIMAAGQSGRLTFTSP